MNSRVIGLATSIAETVIRWGDTEDFLEFREDFCIAMAEKHQELQRQEERDDYTAKQLLDY